MVKSGKPLHLLAKEGDIAERVIAVGDPWRARLLASEMLSTPRLVNENRGFLTFTGEYGGVGITVATHGVGAPSAAIVFEELHMLGARYLVRLGTAGSLVKDLDIGDVVVADGAAHPPGGAVGMYLGSPDHYPASPDIELTYEIYKRLSRSLPRVRLGTIYSSDAFYAEDPGFVSSWSSKGIVAVEMECAVLFVLSKLRGVRSSCALVVSDNLVKGSSVISSPDVLRNRFVEAARAIASVLAEMR